MNTIFRHPGAGCVWALLAALLVTLPVARSQPLDGPLVTMRDNSFRPAALTVEVGQSVTWVNSDEVPHSIIADNGSFNSSYLNRNQRFSYSFDRIGTYSYYCDLHQGMEGVINVLAAPLRPQVFQKRSGR